MTIEWRYTTQEGLGVLSLAGYLGPEATERFSGAVGWALARGTGPVVLDLTGLRGWSACGRRAVAEAAARLAEGGRELELAAVPTDGPAPVRANGADPAVPVYGDLAAALARHGGPAGRAAREWRTDDWPQQD
ncbi:STAS domain-containing protein [Streptomyces sp. NPDC097619]|uniref:STAS domain-containing protein n=1 Tax=Streptomyces sp. NPDC097619 TaxID=3157228 RepID=UPI00332A2A4D